MKDFEISFLSVCSPYKRLNKLVDLYEAQQECHAIEHNLDAITCNPVASAIQK
jgi:hypothetical protein